MSDEELTCSGCGEYAGSHISDRVEAPTKERDEAKALQSCGCSYDTPTDVCLGHHRLFERLYAVQRGKLEAKLAKAVEALEDLVRDCEADYPPSHVAIKYFAIGALAEIKGESHE